MSVTFSVQGARHKSIACPKCGASYPNTLDNGCEETMEGSLYGRCYGMGFTIADAPEMNLANGNAVVLLSFLNQEETGEDICGSLDPANVLRTLAVLESDPAKLTSKSSDNQGIAVDENGVRPACRMVSFGRSLDQVTRYIESLRKIAEAALERGAQISFG